MFTLLNSGKTRSIYGMVMIEALIGVLIAGIVTTSVLAGLTQGMHKVDEARRGLRITQIISEKFETIRLYSWDQINEPGFVPTGFEYSFLSGNTNTSSSDIIGTLTISDPPDSVVFTNDLRLVTIEVRWSTLQKNYTNSQSTLVSRYGLQNYVY